MLHVGTYAPTLDRMIQNLTVVVRDSLAKAKHLTAAGAFTQAAANRIGVSARSTLNGHLRDGRLNAAELKAIANLLGVSTDELAREAEAMQ